MNPGLYVVRRITATKIHVGLLVAGNLLGLSRIADIYDYARGRPLGLLFHFNPNGIQREIVYDLGGWTVDRRIDGDQAAAIARLQAVLNTNRRYDLLLNNCEHVVSYVETGERKSPQLRGLATAAVIIGGIVLLSRSA